MNVKLFSLMYLGSFHGKTNHVLWVHFQWIITQFSLSNSLANSRYMSDEIWNCLMTYYGEKYTTCTPEFREVQLKLPISTNHVKENLRLCWNNKTMKNSSFWLVLLHLVKLIGNFTWNWTHINYRTKRKKQSSCQITSNTSKCNLFFLKHEKLLEIHNPKTVYSCSATKRYSKSNCLFQQR